MFHNIKNKWYGMLYVTKQLLLKLYNYVSFFSTRYLSQVRNISIKALKASKNTNSITFPLYNNYLLLSFPELSIEAFIYTGWVTAWL